MGWQEFLELNFFARHRQIAFFTAKWQSLAILGLVSRWGSSHARCAPLVKFLCKPLQSSLTQYGFGKIEWNGVDAFLWGGNKILLQSPKRPLFACKNSPKGHKASDFLSLLVRCTSATSLRTQTNIYQCQSSSAVSFADLVTLLLQFIRA